MEAVQSDRSEGVAPSGEVRMFGFVRMSSIVLGAVLAALGGLNAFVGFDVPDDTLRRIPGYMVIAGNPMLAVGLGLGIILLAFVAPSSARDPHGWS